MKDREKINAALSFYRHLGIERFKRLVLEMERRGLARGGGHRKNYHPESMTEKGLGQYMQYLRTNAFLHGISIVGVILYDGLLRMVGFHKWFFVLLIVLLLVYNVYCILLQRYNYLKIQKLLLIRHEAEEKKVEKYGAELPRFAGRVEREEVLALLGRVEKAFLERESCTLGAREKRGLEQLAELCGKLGLTERGTQGTEKGTLGTEGNCPKHFLADDLREVEVASQLDVLSTALSDLMDGKHRKERGIVVLRTQDGECEALFRRAFGEGPAESVLMRARILRQYYEKDLQGDS